MYFAARGLDNLHNSLSDFYTSNKLLDVITNSKDIATFFKCFDWKKIAVAPFTNYSKALIGILNKSEISVEYLLDRKACQFSDRTLMNIPIFSYSDIEKLSEVDVIVITSNRYFNDITDELIANNVPIEKVISINDVLFGAERLNK